MYDVSLKRKWDEYSIRETTTMEKEKAIEDVRKEERAKAEAEKRAVALEFKKMGIPVADIAKGTGLTIEEIEKLK